mgnify:CR=1 FL=1
MVVDPPLLSVVVLAICLIVFVILVGNTVLRYASGSSLQWANEVPELLFPWLVMAGVVLAALQGAHIATTVLMEAVPARAARVVRIRAAAASSVRRKSRGSMPSARRNPVEKLRPTMPDVSRIWSSCRSVRLRGELQSAWTL